MGTITIYIPTRGRKDQITYRNLPESVRKRAILVCPKDELAQWVKAGIPAIAHPTTCKSIGPVRQWIVDQHDIPTRGKSIMMLDDDLYFYMRRSDDPTKFPDADDKSVVAVFEIVERYLKKYAHCSIRQREQANTYNWVTFADRPLRALGYNVEILRKTGVRFDTIMLMEDFDVCLKLLKLGYPNAVIAHCVQHQSTSNAPGGCSIYRNGDLQKSAAEELARRHAPFVKLVEKETLKNDPMWKTRVDVRIAWKKAFATSGKPLPKMETENLYHAHWDVTTFKRGRADD